MIIALGRFFVKRRPDVFAINKKCNLNQSEKVNYILKLSS